MTDQMNIYTKIYQKCQKLDKVGFFDSSGHFEALLKQETYLFKNAILDTEFSQW